MRLGLHWGATLYVGQISDCHFCAHAQRLLANANVVSDTTAGLPVGVKLAFPLSFKLLPCLSRCLPSVVRWIVILLVPLLMKVSLPVATRTGSAFADR